MTRLTLILPVLLLTLLVGNPAVSADLQKGGNPSPYEKGKAAEAKKDLTTACKIWRQGAAQMDAKSINGLGWCYFKGWEGKKDYKKAVGYYRTAVEMGWHKAFVNLAHMYRQGFGVPKDTERADRLEKQANIHLQQVAEGGDARAQFNLGWAYVTGKGVHKDRAEAVKWFRLAVKQGHARAQFELGMMYRYGQGVPQDYKTTIKLHTLAAEQGYTDAQNTLGFMYATGKGVPRNYKTAVKWYKLAAEQGDASAQDNLGFMYEDGRGVTQNYKTAVKWYTLAAEQGNARAHLNLGEIYEKGLGVLQDYVRAHMWFNIAASQGHKGGKIERDIVEKRMSPTQVETAQRLARECVQKNYKGC